MNGLVERELKLRAPRTFSLARLQPELDRYVASPVRFERLQTAADERARDAVPALLGDAWSTLRKRVRTRSRPPSDRELHAIRIAAKRVRYGAEAVMPVARRAARALTRATERMQTILGEEHDSVVACRRLRELATGPHAFLAGELAAARERRLARRARGVAQSMAHGEARVPPPP